MSIEELPRADRFMMRLLRIREIEPAKEASAHRALRWSMLVSAIRCIITYVALPLLAPIVSIAGIATAPIGLALSAVAVTSGTLSLRRFWASGHKGRWMYTGFIAVVFAFVAVMVVFDIRTLIGA